MWHQQIKGGLFNMRRNIREKCWYLWRYHVEKVVFSTSQQCKVKWNNRNRKRTDLELKEKYGFKASEDMFRLKIRRSKGLHWCRHVTTGTGDKINDPENPLISMSRKAYQTWKTLYGSLKSNRFSQLGKVIADGSNQVYSPCWKLRGKSSARLNIFTGRFCIF